MTVNHLPGGATLQDMAVGGFGEAGFEGVGFGLGFAVGLGPAATAMAGSGGEFYWGGAASTAFWVDPVEDLFVVVHDTAVPLGRLPVPGAAARARLPGRRRLMPAAPEDVSLYEGLLTTRAIRRYTDEPVPDEALRDILFAATGPRAAPTASPSASSS